MIQVRNHAGINHTGVDIKVALILSARDEAVKRASFHGFKYKFFCEFKQ